MSILKKAAEIAATLDPTLGLELEQEFGSDWEALLGEQLQAVGIATQEKDEFDPKAGEPMRSDALVLSQAEFKKKYKVKDIQVLAESIGVETRAGGKYKREATLVADIYKAL